MKRARALTLFFCCLLLSSATAARAGRLDTEIEKALGKVVAYALEDANGADTDPLLLNWVRAIGARVSAPAPRRDVPYRFSILGSETSNALAAPGGYIFVTRGLLDFVESDDELASVLAHEAGHVSKRHATQQIGGNLLFLALVNQVRGRNAGEIKTAAQVYNVFRALNKSREMEAQADEEGIAYAYAAGYDPNGLVRFFERIGSGRGGGRLGDLLQTHPAPARRLRQAERDTRVDPEDPARREAIAAGYRERGLPGAAETVLRGENPLDVPPMARVRSSEAVAQGRASLVARADAARKRLQAPYRTQRTGGVLQQVLLVNSRPDDYRWLYLAFRAYAVQAQVEDTYSRTLRVLRTAPTTYDALARYAGGSAAGVTTSGGTAAALNSSIGRGEVLEAVERVGGAPAPLQRAAQAALAVLADLNNPLYRPRGNTAWARYGALEGLLRYAESELSRASRASGQAWRLLALARIRHYEARLSELAPEEDAAARAQWADLLTRRLGAPFAAGGPAGTATVRAALSVQLKHPEDLEDGRPADLPWADWVLRKKGIPENIATVMRLLTLDLERETAARNRRQAATTD